MYIIKCDFFHQERAVTQDGIRPYRPVPDSRKTAFVICVSCLSCCLVCSLQPCGHLLGKGWPLGSSVCDVFYVILGQVCYLIASIPALCHLPFL